MAEAEVSEAHVLGSKVLGVLMRRQDGICANSDEGGVGSQTGGVVELFTAAETEEPGPPRRTPAFAVDEEHARLVAVETKIAAAKPRVAAIIASGVRRWGRRGVDPEHHSQLGGRMDIVEGVVVLGGRGGGKWGLCDSKGGLPRRRSTEAALENALCGDEAFKVGSYFKEDFFGGGFC